MSHDIILPPEVLKKNLLGFRINILPVSETMLAKH